MPLYTVYTCEKHLHNPEPDDLDMDTYDMPTLGALKRALQDICGIGARRLVKIDGVSPKQWAMCNATTPPPEQPEPIVEGITPSFTVTPPPPPPLQTISTVTTPSNQWHEFVTDGIEQRIDLSSKLVQKKGWVKVDKSEYKIMLLNEEETVEESECELPFNIYKKDWVNV